MGKYLSRLGRCQRGATAVEYGFIVALIFIAILVAVSAVANKTNAMWSNVSSTFARSAS